MESSTFLEMSSPAASEDAAPEEGVSSEDAFPFPVPQAVHAHTRSAATSNSAVSLMVLFITIPPNFWPLSFGRPRGKTAKPQKSAGHSDRRNQAATVRLFFCMPSFYLSHVNNVRPEKYDLQEKLMHITHRKPRDLFLCTAVSFVSRACYCSKKAFRQPLNAAGRQNL